MKAQNYIFQLSYSINCTYKPFKVKRKSILSNSPTLEHCHIPAFELIKNLT